MTVVASTPAVRKQHSSLFLVGANILPLLGVLFLDWDVAALVVLYWSENLVVGIWNLARMAAVAGLRALPMGLFFTIHYGGFCAVHGLFIQVLLLGQEPVLGQDWPFLFVFLELLVDVCAGLVASAPPAWLLAFAGLFISHGYSFVTNFLLGGERDRVTLQQLMAAPYRRIVALHVAIIIGGFGTLSLGEPLVLLLALVALKTWMDLALHRREHRRLANIDSEHIAAR
jgi:hypothetical protein